MVVFVDTSALYALLDADDINHTRARTAFEGWMSAGQAFITSNYVLLEAAALVQRRLGMAALLAFHHDLAPVTEVLWIDEPVHEMAMRAVLAAGQRAVSMVDYSSFDLMRRRGITAAFTFDQHFADQHFECLPASTPTHSPG